MSLTLYYHPLASFCWKALIALYENDTPFTPRLLRLELPEDAEALRALSPMGKMPVLHDAARGRTIPESTIVIEYLDRCYPGPVRLVPADPERALDARLGDRFFDCYVHEPMQRIVFNRLRPADAKDPTGVAAANGALDAAYDAFDRMIAGRVWASGDDFSLADCAAAPALYYADLVRPIGDARPNVVAYVERLKARPSFARVLKEAEPYFAMWPRE